MTKYWKANLKEREYKSKMISSKIMILAGVALVVLTGLVLAERTTQGPQSEHDRFVDEVNERDQNRGRSNGRLIKKLEEMIERIQRRLDGLINGTSRYGERNDRPYGQYQQDQREFFRLPNYQRNQNVN